MLSFPRSFRTVVHYYTNLTSLLLTFLTSAPSLLLLDISLILALIASSFLFVKQTRSFTLSLVLQFQ